MSEYNGHKDKGHWSVALWLANDESSYFACLAALKQKPTMAAATEHLLDHVLPLHTPDGSAFTYERVLAALEGLMP